MNESEMLMNEVRLLRRLVEAMARRDGMLQWVDSWALGENEGGQFVSLYSTRAGFRICNVYHDKFNLLPEFLRDELPKARPVEISTERARMEKAGKLHACQPFEIIRFKIGDDERDKWRFAGVSRLGRPVAPAPRSTDRTSQPAAAPQASRNGANLKQPPVFATKGDAVQWAVNMGAYPTMEQASAAFDQVLADVDKEARRSVWIGHVTKRVDQRSAA